MSTSPPSRADRIRHRLSSQFSLFLAVAVLLALAGGFVAFQAHAQPDTTTEERVVASWISETGFDHQATVQRDTLAFDAGERLENRSLYFSTVAPELDGSYRYRYTGDATDVNVHTDLRLVVRAVDDTGETPETLWRISEPLATEEATDVEPGETHRVDYSLNVPELANLTERVRGELEASPGRTEILVVAGTEAEGTLNGDPSSVQRSDQMTIEPGRATYAVTTEESGPVTKEAEEQVTVPAEGDPFREWGALVLALVGLGGAGALVKGRRDGNLEVSPDVSGAIYRQQRQDEFAEWISAGRVPPASPDERVVAVDSLADLVDVAIDSNRRVIYNPASDVYVVLDDVRYQFGEGVTDPATEDRHTIGTAKAEAPSDGPTGDGSGPAVEGTGEDR